MDDLETLEERLFYHKTALWYFKRAAVAFFLSAVIAFLGMQAGWVWLGIVAILVQLLGWFLIFMGTHASWKAVR